MSETQPSYEQIHQLLQTLPSATSDSTRDIGWLDHAQVLGISRDATGRLEMFLTGAPLDCNSETVRANLVHDDWYRTLGDEFPANRLVLPSEDHFDAVVAFLCAHLIENGVSRNVQRSFTQSEPVIALALERSRLQGESLIGLIGELLVLRALLVRWPAQTPAVIGSWYGYTRSARDFQVGTVGIEVKATRGNRSRHHVHGLRQIEPGHTPTGGFETNLFITSIGLEAVDSSDANPGAWTLPHLVTSIVELISSSVANANQGTALIDEFLIAVKQYGLDSGWGYDHHDAQQRLMYGQAWQTVFTRSYRMGDPAIAVPHTAECSRYTAVELDSFKFVIDLPNQITGDTNPLIGLPALAEEAGRGAWQ